MPARSAAVALVYVAAILANQAAAEEIHVLNSGGFTQAYKALVAVYEQKTGDRLISAYGASMGDTPEAIPNRIRRGEAADVLIMARPALDGLVLEGRVVAGSEVDLVRSRIAVAVRAGAKRPDISSVDGLKRALLQARSIAYSDSASGVYVSRELFRRLGIEAEAAAKSVRIPGTPVGVVVARGEAEIGFQQLSELLPVPGIQVVGPIPDAVQKVTIFSAGITAASQSPAAARRLIEFLASQNAWPAIRRSGLEPVSERNGASAGRR